jgi:hypothetical protein
MSIRVEQGIVVLVERMQLQTNSKQNDVSGIF